MTDPASEHPALLRSFLDALDRIKALRLPMIELRPREKTPLAAFSGDYDFVADPKDLREILSVFLEMPEERRASGIQLRLSQQAGADAPLPRKQHQHRALDTPRTFRRPDGRRVSRNRGRRASRRSRARPDEDEANAILAAVYVTHVVHKGKDIAAPLQKDRIAFFRDALTSVAGRDDPQSGACLPCWAAWRTESWMRLRQTAPLWNICPLAEPPQEIGA